MTARRVGSNPAEVTFRVSPRFICRCLSTPADRTSGHPYGRCMTTLWSCPNPACPPTENAPREVEEAGEVARGVSERSLSISDLAALLKVPVSTIYSWNRQGADRRITKSGRASATGEAMCCDGQRRISSRRLSAPVSVARATGEGSSRRWRANRSPFPWTAPSLHLARWPPPARPPLPRYPGR
jgi:hypothetical protein